MGTVVSQITNLTMFTQPFIQRPKKTSKLRVTGGEFPAQMSSNAENISNWWRHHENYDSLFDVFRHGKGRWKCV